MSKVDDHIDRNKEKEAIWREVAKQVAHEIRTPLSSMKLNIQHLQRMATREGKVDLPQIERVGGALIQQIDNLAQIASVFSNYAELPKPVFEKISLNQLCKNAFITFGEHQKTCFHLELPEEEIFVQADKNYLLRILNNILKNAVQAIPEGRDARIQMNLQRKNKHAQIKITDNGCGISEEEREFIFIPHFTTKKSGTGLGLAIVKNIVEKLNGQVYFHSAVDKGSLFVVELPIYG